MRPMRVIVAGLWIIMCLIFTGTAFSAGPGKNRTDGNATPPFGISGDLLLTENVQAPPEQTDKSNKTPGNDDRKSGTEDSEDVEDDDEWEA